MFLNTSVRAVRTEPASAGTSRIVSLHAVQLATETEFVFTAKQYADCTGDATVGYLAGAEFRYGREARREFQEALAPVEADLRAGRRVARVGGAEFGEYWWIEVGCPFHQVTDRQEMKDELLRHVLGVWNYIKNWGPERNKAVNYALEWVGMVPGKRESRLLVGDVVLTEQDCHSGRHQRGCAVVWRTAGHETPGSRQAAQPGLSGHPRSHRLDCFLLASSAAAVAEVGVELYEMERIWDRAPGKRVTATRIVVPPRFRGWPTADLRACTTPGKLYRAVLLAAPGVSWAQASVQPPGTTAQILYTASGGCELHNCAVPGFQLAEMDIRAYRHWMQQKSLARALRISPTPMPFGAVNVNNGIAWPLAIFGTELLIDTVLVAFDTSLNVESSRTPAFWKAPTCARDWRLYAKVDGAWQRVHEEAGYYQRRCVVRFTTIRATRLKLEILATQGDNSARAGNWPTPHE